MRPIQFSTCISAALLIVAACSLHPTASKAQLADLSCYRAANGNIDTEKLASDDRLGQIKTRCERRATTAAKRSHAAVTVRQPPSGGSSAFARDDAARPLSVRFLLRQDLSDVGLFSAISETSKAAGAGISWSRDRVAGDTAWSVNGLTAIAFALPTSYDSPLVGVAFAPYAKINKQFHSKAGIKDADSETYGFSGEIGFHSNIRDIWGTPGADYFRASLSTTRDNIGFTDIVQGRFEWIPTYLRIRQQVFGSPFLVHFAPQLTAQYDYVSTGLPVVAFSGERRSFRVGPEASLYVGYLPASSDATQLSAMLKRFYVTANYHWWDETFSGRSGSWFAGGLNYKLDDAGYASISGTYKRGTDEDTAKQVDVVKIELKVKTCIDLRGAAVC